MCIKRQVGQTTVWVRNKPSKDLPEFHSHRERYQISFVSHTSWAKERHSDHPENSNQQHLLRKRTLSISKRTKEKLSQRRSLWITKGANWPLKLVISQFVGGFYDSTCIGYLTWSIEQVGKCSARRMECVWVGFYSSYWRGKQPWTGEF